MIPRRNIIRAIKKSLKQPEYALQNLTKRTKAQFFYNFGKGKSSWPETISLFITYRCNLKCKMCGQWGDQGVFKNYDKNALSWQLSPETIEKLVQEVKFFKPNITLFGGEPMINPDIIPIIKIIKSGGLRCNLITNGTLIKKYASELLDSGLDEIIFSLDGSEKIHDSIRGIPGTFNRALEGFQELNKLKKEQGSQKPFININSTIFEHNYQNFSDTLKSAAKFHPDNFTFHHLLFLNQPEVSTFQQKFHSKFGQVPYDWTGFATENLPNIDPQKIIRQIKKIRQQKPKFNVSFFPNFNSQDIIKWYTDWHFASGSYKNRCMSLWMTAYIFPDGTVRPYHTMNYDLGNIHKESFLSIWNNSKFIQLRKYIYNHKSFEICSKGCTEFFRY
jgi:MoaA/NifB/PqqE/SkfB family radical SAM enzyme